MKEAPFDTLLVEDNDDDAFFVQRAFKTAGVASRITHCRDGLSALNYFEGESDYANRELYPLPHLLLLDIKLPHRTGLEILSWLRSHPELHTQIVIILTSSSEKRHVQEAHRLHVNAFLVKPSSLDGMVELARCIQTTWLNERVQALHERTPGKPGASD